MLKVNKGGILNGADIQTIEVEFPFYVFVELDKIAQMFTLNQMDKKDIFKRIEIFKDGDGVFATPMSEHSMRIEYEIIYINSMIKTHKISSDYFEEEFRKVQNKINSYIMKRDKTFSKIENLTLPLFLITKYNQFIFINDDIDKDNNYVGVMIEGESFFMNSFKFDKIKEVVLYSKFISEDEFLSALIMTYDKLMDIIYNK